MNARSSPPPANEPIQAYYKLSFPNFEYYLQTLSVTIGRRPRPVKDDSEDAAAPVPATSVKTETLPEASTTTNKPSHERSTAKEEEKDALLQLAEAAKGSEHDDLPQIASTSRPHSPQPSTSSGRRSKRSQSHSSTGFPRIDVDLGPLKNVSRLHARIDYDDSIDKFVLYVNGRNGAWVDGQWIGCGGRVALGARTKIQISSRTFYFVLPPPAVPESPLTPETTPEADVAPTAAEECPVDEDISPRVLKHPASRSPSPIASKRRRLKPPRSPRKSPARRPPALSPPAPRRTRASTASSSASSASASATPSPAQHVASLQQDGQNDDELEEDDLVSIGDLEQDELNELRVLDDQGGAGKGAQGKGGSKAGKGVRKSGGPSAKGLATKGRSSSKPSAQSPTEPSSSSHPSQLPVIRPLPVKLAKELLKQTLPPPDPNAPKQPKRYMTQRLIQKTQLAQLPRPPPEKMPPKPPFTYAVLCFRAIQELGGKANLSDIVNWIRDTHEWYRWNDECGWESSVRHNLSSNPGFVKGRWDAEVERIQAVHRQGQKKTKGFFWSVDPKFHESFLEKEREIIEAGARSKAQGKPTKPVGPGGLDGLAGPSLTNTAGLPPSALPAVPVPMMAPRGVGPPPPVGMTMAPALHPHPQMIPPPSMIPTPGPPIPSMHPSGAIGHTPSPGVHIGSAPTPTSTTFSQDLPDVCLSITVGPPPPGADTGPFSSSPFMDGPPITLRNGALFLNPTIFSGLSQEQLDDLQKLKAQAALEILMTYTKNYVKEQIVKKGKAKAKSKGNGGAPPAGGGGGAKPSGSGSAGDAVNGVPARPPSSTAVTTPQFDTASVLAVATLAAASATTSVSPPPLNPSPVIRPSNSPMPPSSASPPTVPPPTAPLYQGLPQVPHHPHHPGQPPHPYTYYPYQPSGSWAYSKAPPAPGAYPFPVSPYPPGATNQPLPAPSYHQQVPHFPPPLAPSPSALHHRPPHPENSNNS